MNKVLLTGRVVKSLELRNTIGGTAVCEFTLATNRPVVRDEEKKADFIKCIVYGKQAENLCKYQDKGSLIAVFGENRIDTWENEKGEFRSKFYVLVNQIEYLGTKKEVKEETKEETNPFEDFSQQIQIDESELPFDD